MLIDYNLTNIELDIDAYIDNQIFYKIIDKSYSQIMKSGFFYKMYFCKDLPEFGWKIHVSAIPSNAEKILKLVSSYCIEKEIAFKFLRDDEILKKTLSKPWDRISSGKFITIYPENEKSFISIIEDLYGKLENFKGPYVLSDKRYKDCKVLYYRFGRIEPLFNQENLDACIIGPNGEEYIDAPVTYYRQPLWIKDPFEDTIESDEESHGLDNGRYSINKVIHMSNTGGVYLAYDKKLNAEVILKEARPYLTELDLGIDSIELRVYEEKILRELQGIKGVPHLLNNFYEWEHYFISVNYIQGQSVQEFITSPKILDDKKTNMSSTRIRFIDIFIDMLTKVHNIHKVGVSIGDISTFNIMIDEYDKVHFLDFELSSSFNTFNKSSRFMYTRGYRLTKIKEDLSNRFTGDLEAIGLVMLSFFHSSGCFFSLYPNSVKNFINELINDQQIDNILANIIENLILNPNKIQLEDILDDLEDSKNNKNNMFNIESEDPLSEQNLKLIIKQLKQTIINNVNTDSGKIFNLTPSFNKSGLFTGDLGILIILKKVATIFPENKNYNQLIEKYMSEDLLDIQNPSLYSGTAGVSYGLYKLGKTQESIDMINKTLLNIKNSPKNYTVFKGFVGLGLVLLYLYKVNQDRYYLEDAIRLGDIIINDFQEHNFNVFQNQDDSLELGFYNGLAGISYYLTLLYANTKNKKYLDNSFLFIQKIISCSVIENHSAYIPVCSNQKMYPPSLLGAAGVAKAVFEINIHLKNNELTIFFEKLLNTLSFKYNNNPSYIDGLSGNGLLLLEFYKRTGDLNYLSLSEELLRSVLLFKYSNNSDVYFPESSLLRTNLNYCDGIAGILDYIIEYYSLKYL